MTKEQRPTELVREGQLFPNDWLKRPLKLEQPAIRLKIFKTLAVFADYDSGATLNREQAGRVYHELLKLPFDELVEFLREYCGRQKIEMPALPDKKRRGRPMSNGRNLLAAVVYANYPALLVKAGKRGTRAGKQITMCLNRYKAAAGLGKPRDPDWPKKVPRGARPLLVALLGAATALHKTDVFEEICATAFGVRTVKRIYALSAPSDETTTSQV